VFVADARYLDVGVDVTAPSGTSLPFVVFRTGTGEISCPPVGSPPLGDRLYVERRGADVSYGQGGVLNHCATVASSLRVAVGLRGADAQTHAQNLIVTRLGTAQP
jgi:hypothetical protein